MKLKKLIGGSVVLLAAGLTGAEPVRDWPALDGGVMALRGATVIPMDGSGAHEGWTILVRDGRIAEVGSDQDVSLPQGATVIDAAGKLVIPGLYDMHVHIVVPTDFPLYVTHGVTTVFNMAGAPFIDDMAHEVARGDQLGPAIYTTGPQLKTEVMPGEDTAVLARTPEEARLAVAATDEAGYEFVKVWGPISPEVFGAVMDEAHKRELRVTGHIPRDVGLYDTLDGGIESIAHVEEYFNKHFRRTFDDGDLARAAEASADAGVRVITTLITYPNIADIMEPDMAGLMERPEMAWIDPARAMLWGPDYNAYRRNLDREPDWYRQAGRFKQTIAGALHRAGVQLLAGSDAGGFDLTLIPGASLHDELELLVESGMTPHEALASATCAAAAYLGDDAGVIAPGRRADLVVLGANPLERIGNTRSIEGVLVGGRWLDRANLDEVLESVVRRQERSAELIGILMSGDPEAIGAYIARQKAANPGEAAFEAAAPIVIAYALAMGGKASEALALLGLISLEHPDNYFPYLLRASLLLAGGHPGSARADLERVVELKPRHAGARRMLAELD